MRNRKDFTKMLILTAILSIDNAYYILVGVAKVANN